MSLRSNPRSGPAPATAASDPPPTAPTRILSREELDTIDEAQHTIALRSTVLCYVLEGYQNDRHYDPLMHEVLQELAADIWTAAAAIKTAMAAPKTGAAS